MMLIDKEALITELDKHIDALPEPEDWQKFIMDAVKGIVRKQPEITLPPARDPDPSDGASGYWFDKGWNAYREELNR